MLKRSKNNLLLYFNNIILKSEIIINNLKIDNLHKMMYNLIVM